MSVLGAAVPSRCGRVNAFNPHDHGSAERAQPHKAPRRALSLCGVWDMLRTVYRLCRAWVRLSTSLLTLSGQTTSCSIPRRTRSNKSPTSPAYGANVMASIAGAPEGDLEYVQ